MINQAREAGDQGVVELQRQIVAAKMVRDSYKQRGINSTNVDAETRQKDIEVALASLEKLNPAEIERRHDEALEALANEPNPALEQADAQADAAGANNDVRQAAPIVVRIPAAEPREEGPSLVGLFFKAMFGPIDAVFILLAFFTAYKLGSGAATD